MSAAVRVLAIIVGALALIGCGEEPASAPQAELPVESLTRWGMTPAEEEKAFAQLGRLSLSPDGSASAETENSYIFLGTKFSVLLGFDEGRLEGLTLQPASTSICAGLNDALRRKFGPPVGRQRGTSVVVGAYLDRRSTNVIRPHRTADECWIEVEPCFYGTNAEVFEACNAADRLPIEWGMSVEEAGVALNAYGPSREPGSWTMSLRRPHHFLGRSWDAELTFRDERRLESVTLTPLDPDVCNEIDHLLDRRYGEPTESSAGTSILVQDYPAREEHDFVRYWLSDGGCSVYLSD